MSGNEFDNLVKEILSNIERILPELEEMKKILDEATWYHKDMTNKLENLVREWYCVWDITLDYRRHECEFKIFPTSDKVTIVASTPDYIRIVVNNTTIEEIKKAVKEELVKNFDHQIRATSKKIIDILEIAYKLIKKDVASKYMELSSKIGEIDTKIYQLRKKVDELEEKKEKLLQEIDELEERRAELLQEIYSLEAKLEAEKEEEEKVTKEVENIATA